MSEKCNQINVIIGKQSELNIVLEKQKKLDVEIAKTSIGGSYPPLSNKPSINDVILLGNKNSEDLHLQDEMDEITLQDIDKIIFD